ncbi:MAG: 50S ribosomal protein L24 [Phycisphaera sp.]|nr:50S ribosomal protein L24 [Phycisphaera sp.]
MPRHIRKGDQVIVTAGKDRGRIGTVLRVIPKDSKVVVQGINVKKRHMRPTQTNPQGGIIDKEMPLHWSNVSPAVDGKPSRVRFQTKDGKKVRVAVRGGGQIGQAL